MKYYIVAGEASGDMHGANLLKELRKLDNKAHFRGWGGDMMKDQGMEIVKHIEDISFMGFTEVLMNLKTILNNLKYCKEDILSYCPDALILIDYPGFNLRIAKFAHQQRIKVFYYISPQIWAWKQSRVYKIRKYVDRMLVILPFEKDFYARFAINVDFVGHPLLDAIEQYKQNKSYHSFREKNSLSEKPIIAVLPGSRKQEISRMLDVMISVCNNFRDYQFVIAGVPSVKPEFYYDCMKKNQIPIVFGQTYDLLMNSVAAVVTSGTATLETALFGVPQVVCYKGSEISYRIAKQLIKVKYISLVNLVLDRPVVKELIQKELNTSNLNMELNKILSDKSTVECIKNEYQLLLNVLGKSGASQNAANLINSSI